MTNPRARSLTLILLLLALPACRHADSAAPAEPRAIEPGAIAARAIDGSAAEREAAIAELRAMGPEGLRLLMADPFVASVRRLPSRWDAPRDAERARRMLDTVDRVAAQRDALASGLYWHVSLDAAREQAQREGKPILSLRLLGRLDEDRSCANSRFFRTVLYPDPAVAHELRSRYVLHWESVRPVPQLTVDFGDGRVLQTTITGNSIHYILMPDGQPIDALPGLWGSRAFLAEIERARDLAATLMSQPVEARAESLRAWHATRLAQLRAELEASVERLNPAERELLARQMATSEDATGSIVDDIIFNTGSFVSYPDGAKTAVELPFMRGLIPDIQPMRGQLPDAAWSALARLHADETVLDEASRALVRAKQAGRPGAGTASGENPAESLEPLFERLQRSIAEDTVRNRYMMGARLHEWFATGRAPADVSRLNEMVYRDLFMSPVNDAWLGLVPPDAYTGLDRAGHGTDS